MTIDVKVLAHSRHPGCPDLFSVQARYPRFVHAEVMTHRVFCRNASSSRAIPVERMIQDVLDDPTMPVSWGKNQKGMQAGEELTGRDLAIVQREWLTARDAAVQHAREMARIGAHKQIANRILEPFGHISVIITATEWQNFFDLRCHPAADPTMRALAEAIRDAMAQSTPARLGPTDWHLPYVSGQDALTLEAPMLSAARCARVSYLNHDGSNPDQTRDLALAEMLERERHLSPFEHPATPVPGERHGPLVGWKHLRTFIEFPGALEVI